MTARIRADDTVGGDDAAGDTTTLPGLDETQRRLVHLWLGEVRLVADLSWGLVDTAVLHVRLLADRADGGSTGEVIIKASGPDNRHLGRELTAHRRWLAPLRERGTASVLHHADAGARILVTEYLPGDLVQGHPAEHDPGTYRQAGELLAQLHGQDSHTDAEHNKAARDMGMHWLDLDHRIEPTTVVRLRAALEGHPTGAVTVVPTHGDYTPRNWLVHQGRIAVIDFGRARWRPAQTDFARLAVRQFRTDPAFEREFLAGYGSDPREDVSWDYLLLTEAIGTAAWAYQVGDERFEGEGHRMIANALERLEF